MASGKEIRRRIKSVTSTKQIISAMELMSVIKMQKAITANAASRPYADSANEILAALAEGTDISTHRLMATREVKKLLIVLITSDKGLAGGLNSKAVKKALEVGKTAKEVDFVTIGKKGRDLLRSMGYKIVAEFTKLSENPDVKKIMPVIEVAIDEFVSENYDQVILVYPKFISTLTQEPTAEPLLPFITHAANDAKKSAANDMITFEPSKDELLEDLISRILETKVWHALVETTASEHSARMLAMKNANENAEELIDDLTLNYNQTRQAGITREIAEISAGKMILED